MRRRKEVAWWRTALPRMARAVPLGRGDAAGGIQELPEDVAEGADEMQPIGYLQGFRGGPAADAGIGLRSETVSARQTVAHRFASCGV
jgi:hypothetical protein